MFDIVAYNNSKNLVTSKEIELLQLEEQLKETALYKQIEACKKELEDLKKRDLMQQDKIIQAMLQNNLKEIKGNGYCLKIKDTSRPFIDVIDINEVPAEFIRIKKEVDKRAILNLYQTTGVLTSGTNVVQDPKWKITIKESK